MGRFWVPHAERVWTPCRLESDDGQVLTLISEDDEVLTWPTSTADALEPVQDCQLHGVEDVCTLPAVSEAALLHTLRVRYFRQEIYTRVARILISVNPFRPLPIYGLEWVLRYQQSKDSRDLPPHIYAIGHDALMGLSAGYKDQAIVISGESGAGKTESAKFLLNFVAESVKDHSQAAAGAEGLEAEVVRTNPILEAFGNASTTRNANSSRFGKWLDLRFSEALTMRGCRITSYLLEVTRVCVQAVGERGFHIFYQLLQARSLPELRPLALQDVENYRYLQQSPTSAGIDDAGNFLELRKAFVALGFTEEEQLEVFQLLAGILELGNCEFADSGESEQELQLLGGSGAAIGLGVPATSLQAVLLRRSVKTGRDVIETPLRPEQARAVRDGLSRAIYGRLFDWLIEHMNARLHLPNGNEDSAGMSVPNGAGGSHPEGRDRLIGILDISGFESFGTNSLEQLLINLSNEQLQLQFNEAVFKSEIEDCAAEGVDLGASISYVDNSDCVVLLEGRSGILDMLDEEIAMPQSSDVTFANKVLKLHGSHSRLVVPKFSGAASFGIRHYAATVSYSCDGFLEKNAERPPSDGIIELLASSSLPLLRLLSERLRGQVSAASPKGVQAKSATLRFRRSLRELMAKIHKAETHYVRCIKPNSTNIPEAFTAGMVHEQLRYSGVLEAVRIRKQGFAARLRFEEFVHRFQCIRLLSGLPRLEEGSPRAASATLLQLAGVEGPGAVLGNTKVFLKEEVLALLEASRRRATEVALRHVQRLLRGARLRKRLAPALPALRAAFRWIVRHRPKGSSAWSSGFQSLAAAEDAARALTALLHEITNAEVGFAIPMMRRLEEANQRLSEEVPAWRRLSEMQDSLDDEMLSQALATASRLGVGGTEVVRCQKQLTALRSQRPLCEAMRTVATGGALDQARQLLAMLAEAGLTPASAQWLPALDGSKLHQQLVSMVEEEDHRLERLAAQRREVHLRLVQKERARDLAISDALRAAEEASSAAECASVARRTAERAACLAIAEEVTCLSESLQLCALSEAKEDTILEDVSDRCLVAAERTKATAWGGELRRLSLELADGQPRSPAAFASACAALAAVAEGLRQEPGLGVALPSTEPPPPPHGPAAASPASYAQLLRQVDQLQGALAREKLVSASLQAEIETIRALRGTGLLIS